MDEKITVPVAHDLATNWLSNQGVPMDGLQVRCIATKDEFYIFQAEPLTDLAFEDRIIGLSPIVVTKKSGDTFGIGSAISVDDIIHNHKIQSLIDLHNFRELKRSGGKWIATSRQLSVILGAMVVIFTAIGVIFGLRGCH